ncbi:MAG: hypothetical protein K6A62_05735 [Bacteroidales bacterium]|nr:hypothetical protein [Bacteroidales bacterium]
MLKEKQKLTLPCAVFCAVLAAVLAWRWQRIFYLGCADYILSDTPNHIRLALEHNDYGLCSYLIRLLWAVGGEHFGQVALSMILTANQFFGIFTLWLLLRRMFPELERSFALRAVMLAHLCGTWIFPGQTEMYLGAYNGNVYHNMTVVFSRSLIPLNLLLFFRLWDARRARLPGGAWIGFTLCLLVTTMIKPNFLGAMAPVVFVMLVADFAKTRARGFKNEFLIGLAFIPSLAATLWTSLIIYAEGFAGTSSGVGLRALTLPMLAALLFTYLRGTLLPIWSFAFQGPRETEQRGRLAFIAALVGVSILEALLLTETGFRENDGNFRWGSIALYTLLFSLAIALLMRMPRNGGLKEPRRRLVFAVGLALLLGHLLVGVYCLHQPLRGEYFWIYF